MIRTGQRVYRRREPLQTQSSSGHEGESKNKDEFDLNGLLKFLLVIFRGRRPMEDDLTNIFTSLHFPDTCVTTM